MIPVYAFHSEGHLPYWLHLWSNKIPDRFLSGRLWNLQHNCVGDYKNPLHLDVVDRYLRRMGDKTIPDEAPPSLELFYPP